MLKISEYRTIIEKAISDLVFPAGNVASLYQPILYGLSAGGKRLRPVLTLMGADSFGNNYQDAIVPALGIEMFHNFTLFHDDVMDKSEFRRGRPTVHKKYNDNAAILSGDTMLTLAYEYISKVPVNKLRNILNSFNDMAIKVYEGQSLDMTFENSDNITVNDYIKMIEYKTGALLGASVKIGAIIGNASDKDADIMYEFGKNIGIAFQIQDDWLDTFGDSSTFGKPIGGDINNSKKTYLYVSAFSEGGQTADALKAAYNIIPGEMRRNTVTRLYEKIGMSEKSKKAVNQYLGSALKAINETSLSKEVKEKFQEFAEKLIGRKK